MEDPAIKAALERFDRIKQEIAVERNKMADAQVRISKLQAESADLDLWIVKWHELVGRPILPTAAERIVKEVVAEKPKRPNNPDKSVVVDKALEIIREHGEPMGRRALFDALAASGVVLEGTDPQMVLSTMLWRSKDKVRRLTGFGYWPANEPYAPHDDIVKSITI